MKLTDIPQFTREASYRINQSWDSIESWIQKERCGISLDLNPDFQRAHVWTELQQIRYVEFCLQGGKGSNELRFNCVGWMDDFRGPFVLVDGKQRLEAVQKFMRSELPVFGLKLNEYEDKLRWATHDFILMVNNLQTRKQVLQWYLDINAGGVAHTEEEIYKVRRLLDMETKGKP